jgi:hypothetical protein
MPETIGGRSSQRRGKRDCDGRRGYDEAYGPRRFPELGREHRKQRLRRIERQECAKPGEDDGRGLPA